MREYYCDSVFGNDENDGLSISSPIKSIQRLNQMINNSDVSIFLKRNSVYNFPLIIGSEEKIIKNIKVSDYGEGHKPIINANNANSAITVNNVNDICIENLEVTNISDNIKDTRRGIYFYYHGIGGKFSNITLKNLYVHNINTIFDRGSGGIIFWCGEANSPVTMENVIIEDCVVKNTEAQGITFSSAYSKRVGIDWTELPYNPSNNVIIRNNYVSNCGGDGIFQSCAENVQLSSNTVVACCFAGNTPYAGVWPHNSQNIVMNNNEVFGTKLVAGDGQGYDVDINCTDTLVKNNLSYYNEGGFILICTSGDQGGYNNNITLKNNLSVEDDGQIFTLSGPVKHIKIKNNKVICKKKPYTRLIGMYQWGETGGGPDDVLISENDIEMNSNGKNQFYDGSKYEFTENMLIGTYDYSDIKNKISGGINNEV